jgi:hypothetical protein
MSAVVTFASLRQEQEWADVRLPRTLRTIVEEAAEYALNTWGWMFCLTSIYRTEEENVAAEAKTTIHCVWRAVDVRTRSAQKGWVDDVTFFVNAGWLYDPMREHLPVAYSAPHGDGPHLHLQVHPSTLRRAA